MNTTIRSRIVGHLNRERTATVLELSRLLGVTKADVQYHLQKLMEGSEVEAYPETNREAKGRPQLVYRIAAERREGNYLTLTDILLQQLPQGSATEQQACLERLAQTFCSGAILPPGPTRRLNHAVDFLNTRHFQARWEAHHNGPHILFQNCPYAAIVDNHPLLCRLDQTILEFLLGKRLVQIQKIKFQTEWQGDCVFSSE